MNNTPNPADNTGDVTDLDATRTRNSENAEAVKAMSVEIYRLRRELEEEALKDAGKTRRFKREMDELKTELFRAQSLNHSKDGTQKQGVVHSLDARRESPGLEGRVLIHDWMEGEVQTPDMLIDGILYAGRIHALNGEPGKGKSLCALWASLQVMNAGHNVLYLDAENGPRVTTSRLIDLGADASIVQRHFRYYSGMHLVIMKESLAKLTATFQEAAPALVVFDSMSDFLGMAGASEDNADDITRWITKIVQPLKDQGAACLILDQLTKSREGRGNYARGSGQKLAKTDVTWSLTQEKPSTEREWDRSS